LSILKKEKFERNFLFRKEPLFKFLEDFRKKQHLWN